MNIRLLAEQLAKYEPTLLEQDTLLTLKSFKLITAGVSIQGNDLLFGRLDDFQRFGLPPRAANLLCVGDVETARALFLPTGVNCLIISEHPDLFLLINEVLEILNCYSQMDQVTDLLLKSASRSMGNQLDLAHTAHTAAQLFSNPVAIFSTTGRAFVFKKSSPDFPDLFKDYETKRFSEEFTRFLDSAYDQTRTAPQLCAGFLGCTFRTLVCAIRNLGVVVSYMLVFEEEPFRETDLLLAGLFSAWIGEEIRRGTIVLDDDNTLIARFISTLLSGELTDKAEIRKRAAQLNMPQHGSYALLALDTSEMSYQYGTPNSVCAMLGNQFPNSYTAVHQEYALALIALDKLDYGEIIDRIQVSKLCGTFHIRAGISYAFSGLDGLSVAFDQARHAIEIGSMFDRGEPLHRYDDCAVYDLLLKAGGAAKLRAYCYPPLLELLEYDRQYNTAYAYTLYVLLLTGGKQLAAAKALNIHRSTMQYRIERIIKLTSLDLSDNFCLVRLYLSYGILILSGELDPETYYQL